MTLSCYFRRSQLAGRSGTIYGQGYPGTQNGTGSSCGAGRVPVADRRLGTACAVAGETEAAAALAKTMVSAKMRTASFIVGNLS